MATRLCKQVRIDLISQPEAYAQCMQRAGCKVFLPRRFVPKWKAPVTSARNGQGAVPFACL